MEAGEGAGSAALPGAQMATTIATNRIRLREVSRRAGHAAPQLVIDFMLPPLGCAPQRLHPRLLGEMNETTSE